MDSLSQAALGAAFGELVLGRSIGRRAALLGAGLGTLPDLDVLVPHADAVDAFTRHRSWSHSAFVLTAASLPLAALARRALGRTAPARAFGHWWFGVWLILVTHPLLDGFTLYGTQLWWPLPVRPVAIGSVFIIDPLYTLPLLVGVVWLWRRRDAVGRRANVAGLAASTAYLGATLAIQAHVADVARASLASAGIEASRTLVAPLPMSLLWRVVALEGDSYHEGWRSLLDDEPGMRFRSYERGVRPTGDWPPIERLEWFTEGFLRTRERDGTLVATDLRLGAEAGYVFSFVVAERDTTDASDWRAVIARELPPAIEPATLARLAGRVIDERAFDEREDER